MHKSSKLFFAMIFTIMALIPLHYASAASTDTNWYWISSDSKYSKFYAPKAIKIISEKEGIPTLLQDTIKIGYSPAGATQTVANLKLPIKTPQALSYSIARVWINPQERTFRIVEETFYDKQGTALYKSIPQTPILRDINSQSFYEKLYANIVDRVFNQGEGSKLAAKDRWLTIWDNNTGDNAADLATMRQNHDNVYVWLWRDNKNSRQQVTSIDFVKKEYNLAHKTYRILNFQQWTPEKGWTNKLASVTTQPQKIESNTVTALEFAKIRSYALRNPSWTYRYQLYNPTLKHRPTYAVNTDTTTQVTKPAKATKKTATKSASPAAPAADKKVASAPATSPAPDKAEYNPNDNHDFYGPIGPAVQ